MLSSSPKYRVTLWSEAAGEVEALVAEILTRVPRARVEVLPEHTQVRVDLSDEDREGVLALTSLLQTELSTRVYGYRCTARA